MTNFNLLEELRTKEELVNYFEERGQSITEEEIEALKKSYEQARENINILNLDQLNKVAGGMIHAKAEVGKSHAGASHSQTGPTPPDQFRTLSIERAAEEQLERMQTSAQPAGKSHIPADGAASQVSQTQEGSQLYPSFYNPDSSLDTTSSFRYMSMFGTDAPNPRTQPGAQYNYR